MKLSRRVENVERKFISIYVLEARAACANQGQLQATNDGLKFSLLRLR